MVFRNFGRSITAPRRTRSAHLHRPRRATLRQSTLYDVSGTTVEVLAVVAKSEAESWLAQFADPEMKEVPLSEIKDDLSRFLREAETQEIVITRHGKPAGVLIGFESEEDWFEYRLEHDARFLRRIEQARNSLRAGRGIRLEDLEAE
jgi:prevent-host-death family protein